MTSRLSLKTLSLNCNGTLSQPEQLLKLVSKTESSVVALQECNPKQIRSLLSPAFHIVQPPGPLGYGKCNLIALNSQITLEESFSWTIPGPERKVVAARCRYQNFTFLVSCLHLKSGRSPEDLALRKEQLQALLKKKKWGAVTFAFFLGDFNMTESEDYSSRNWTWGPLLGTYCSRNTFVQQKYPHNKSSYSHPYDRIYFTGACTCSSAQIQEHLVVSDHYAISFVLQITPQKTERKPSAPRKTTVSATKPGRSKTPARRKKVPPEENSHSLCVLM